MATYMVVSGMVKECKERKERIYRNRTRYLELFDDKELLSRYRMSRFAIESLVDMVRPLLKRQTQRSTPLDPELQVLVTLRFLGKGGFQSELADLHGISQPSVSRAFSSCLHCFVGALDLIKFPNDDQTLRQVKAGFYEIAGFPRVIGTIDGTLVPIIRPSTDEEAFVCRKGFHAINVQAICDATLRFTNIVCKWPGSTHDSFILSNSAIGMRLEANTDADGWLLGDSGYACKSWLLTPYVNPAPRGEEAYNKAHIKTRNTVERAFGLLKSRFRCLHKSTGFLPFHPAKAHRVVYVACQLHNYCIDLREPVPPEPVEEEVADEDNGTSYQGAHTQDGYAVRRKLVQDIFT